MASSNIASVADLKKIVEELSNSAKAVEDRVLILEASSVQRQKKAVAAATAAAVAASTPAPAAASSSASASESVSAEPAAAAVSAKVRTPFVAIPEEAEDQKLVGDVTFKILTNGTETLGSFAVIQFAYPANHQQTPKTTYQENDVLFTVISGSLDVTVNSKATVTAGCTFFVPKNTSFCFNFGDKPCVLQLCCFNASLLNYFTDLARASKHGLPDETVFAAINGKNSVAIQ